MINLNPYVTVLLCGVVVVVVVVKRAHTAPPVSGRVRHFVHHWLTPPNFSQRTKKSSVLH